MSDCKIINYNLFSIRKLQNKIKKLEEELKNIKNNCNSLITNNLMPCGNNSSIGSDNNRFCDIYAKDLHVYNNSIYFGDIEKTRMSINNGELYLKHKNKTYKFTPNDTIIDTDGDGVSDNTETISYVWKQLGQDIDGEAADDQSGFSVSLSDDGSIVAIGAIYNNGENGGVSGHVRVYKYNGASWEKLGQDIDGEAASDYSGWFVSLSSDGSIVAIGAPANDGENGDDSGHVRVFQYNGASWDQLGQDIDGEATNDLSGYYVSLSSDGSIVAIGAVYNNGENGVFSGHVRVYKYNGASWEKLGQDIDGEAANDWSGFSVSLSSDGSIVAIGARYNDGENKDENKDESGHVRVFQYNGASWEQLGQDIDGEEATDQSGYSVSLSSDGSIVAIGTPYDDGNGFNSGHVRVYQYNDSNSSWEQLGQDIDGEAKYDQSGYSVSLSSNGSIVAIGAVFNNGENGDDSGHVRVYQFNGASWEPLGQDIDGEAANDNSGYSVSLSSDGSIVAIGAPVNNGNGTKSGHVRVYELNDSTEQNDASGDWVGDNADTLPVLDITDEFIDIEGEILLQPPNDDFSPNIAEV